MNLKLLLDPKFAAVSVFAALLIWDACGKATAGSLDSLDRFYESVFTYTARFDQVVLDEGLVPIEESSGVMQIARPGRFRWDYEPPNEQTIVGDGSKVWIYDVELEQITVRPQEQSLGRTPATILAGSGDITANYEIRDLGPAGSLTWVAITPRDSDGDSGFDAIRIGFEGDELRVLELVDGLGQTTRITMSGGAENVPVDDSRFVLTPPDGVDVIDESG
jgi:outer membrane lipoprotein carrier protein